MSASTTSIGCDILVIGGGPAGIAAAISAREATPGARVMLVDAGRSPGGQIWRTSSHGRPAGSQRRWLMRLARVRPEILSRSAIHDLEVVTSDGQAASPRDARGFIARGEREGEPLSIASRRVVLATGARELLLPFPGWTLPGVVGVGGLQALVKAGLVAKGKRVVVAGSGPLLVAVAAALAREGGRVLIVAEQAPRRAVTRYLARLWKRPSVLARAVMYRAAAVRASYRMGSWVTRAHGDVCVRAVDITDGSRRYTVDCDYLAVGYGLAPNVELASVAGCSTDSNGVMVDEYQRTTVPGLWAAGEPTGIGGVERALVEGEIAGFSAAEREDLAAPRLRERLRRRRDALALNQGFQLRSELRALARSDTTICRCEDVSLGEVHRDWSVREAKLYTRAGMGACQGRVCGAALHFLYGWTPDSIRPPTSPVLVSTHAGADAVLPLLSTAPHGASS